MEERSRLYRSIYQQLNLVLFLIFVILILSFFISIFGIKETNSIDPATTSNTDTLEVVDSIHVATGFIAKGDYQLVIQNCVTCHSSKLVTQNKHNREGWLSLIRWMQKTQKLHDLGKNEDKILDYLSKYYAPNKMGRRANLENIEWYELEE